MAVWNSRCRVRISSQPQICSLGLQPTTQDERPCIDRSYFTRLGADRNYWQECLSKLLLSHWLLMKTENVNIDHKDYRRLISRFIDHVLIQIIYITVISVLILEMGLPQHYTFRLAHAETLIHKLFRVGWTIWKPGRLIQNAFLRTNSSCLNDTTEMVHPCIFQAYMYLSSSSH